MQLADWNLNPIAQFRGALSDIALRRQYGVEPFCLLPRVFLPAEDLVFITLCKGLKTNLRQRGGSRFLRELKVRSTVAAYFRASFVHLTRRRAASLFSYAKPNKRVRFFAATSFDGYEPEGREFESPRAHHSSSVRPGDMGYTTYLRHR